MTHGITEEKQILKQQEEETKQQLSQIQINIKGESDFMTNVIDQRNQDINAIANIMSDINEIAKDIAVETQVQGEKLEKLDDNMATADDNATKALD